MVARGSCACQGRRRATPPRPTAEPRESLSLGNSLMVGQRCARRAAVPGVGKDDELDALDVDRSRLCCGPRLDYDVARFAKRGDPEAELQLALGWIETASVEELVAGTVQDAD